VATARSKHLVLILARELASNLATPTLIADAEGTLVFFNEAAEEIVGRGFSEIGEMPMDEFSASFTPRTRNHAPLADERRPTRIALEERRAAHEQLWVLSRDGVDRQVAITAFPLFAEADEFVGIVGIFWRE
jgi:PAS domain S-box-containing protein